MNPAPAPPQPVALDEAALIEGCRRRERAAQAELYRQHRPFVARVAQRLLGPRSDGLEDVVQEVFITAMGAIEGFRGDARLSTWLYRVTVNVSLQWVARRRRGDDQLSGDGELPALPDARTPQRHAEGREAMRAVYRILDTLTPPKRLVFILSEIEQLDPREIAAVTGVPVATVRTRLHYARREFFDKAARTAAFDPPSVARAA